MVEYITYKKKDLPFKISSYAIKGFTKEHKKKIDEIDDGSMEELETLLYYSLESGFREEGKVFDIKREEAEWILDDCLWEFVDKIENFFPKGEGTKDGKKK